MFSKITVALSAAIVLSAAIPASAATRHVRVTHGYGKIYDLAPGNGGCSPSHPPLCSNICSGSGPCAPPDSW